MHYYQYCVWRQYDNMIWYILETYFFSRLIMTSTHFNKLTLSPQLLYFAIISNSHIITWSMYIK